MAVATMLAWLGLSLGVLAWQYSGTEVSADAGNAVPVYSGDVVDRPYRVIGPVRAEIHWHAWLSAPPSPGDLDSALWREAQLRGAEAVIDARQLGRSPGRIVMAGTAVRFRPPCASLSPGEPAC